MSQQSINLLLGLVNLLCSFKVIYAFTK
jgi:hypothetical protein